MTDGERIDLAHAPGFRLGRVEVRPGTRELVRDDGAVEVIEPRVMQVLVALARADGGILTRDDLTRCCWDSRVVGEDAINRVISRLRRSAEGFAGGDFRVETITKVGYRLVGADVAATSPPELTPTSSRTRRAVVLGAGAAVIGGVSAVALWPRRKRSAAPSAEITAMMNAGYNSVRQATGDGDLQARGIFRHVTEIAPDYADGWGALASMYANETHFYRPDRVADLTARARDAMARARALDPDNFQADIAELSLLPSNAWLSAERRYEKLSRRAPDEFVPDDFYCRFIYSALLARVGRMSEAARMLESALAKNPAIPVGMFNLMYWQWSAGRGDDVDRTIARAMELFPRNFAVWFGAFYIRVFSGRLAEAIRQAEDVTGRPATIADDEVERVLAHARAMDAQDRPALARVRRDLLDRAHEATGYAENSIQFLCAMGFVDDAMAVADAYFLDRGFTVPAIRFPRGQNSYTALPERRTWLLFFPVTAPLRAHPRFPGLLRDIGLERYWRESGTVPDYRRSLASTAA